MQKNNKQSQQIELTLVLEIPSSVINEHQQEKELYKNTKIKHSDDILSDSYVDHNILD